MPESSILAVRNLAKRYGGVTALQDMNLRVERGAIHAVVGENGTLTMAELRDLLGTTRKYAVPIGEYLDRTGLTIREGDTRRLSPSAAMSPP